MNKNLDYLCKAGKSWFEQDWMTFSPMMPGTLRNPKELLQDLTNPKEHKKILKHPIGNYENPYETLWRPKEP